MWRKRKNYGKGTGQKDLLLLDKFVVEALFEICKVYVPRHSQDDDCGVMSSFDVNMVSSDFVGERHCSCRKGMTYKRARARYHVRVALLVLL